MGNAGILLGGKAVNAVLNLAVVALTARTLGLEAFGVLVLIHAYVQTVGEFVRFQSWQVLLNYGTQPFSERRMPAFQQVLRFSALLDGLSGVAGVLTAVAGVWLIGSGLGWPESHRSAVSLYAISVFFMVSATPTGALRLTNRFDLLAMQSAIESWIKLMGAAWAWFTGADLFAFLAIWFVGKVAAFVFLFVSASWTLQRCGALADFRWRSQEPLVPAMPGLWSFVWTTNFNATLGLAFTQLGTLMVGALLGPTEAALYRVAKQLADAVAKPAKLIVPALYPELARLALGSDRAPLRRLIIQLALAGGGIATALLLVVSLIGGPALQWLIGPEYVAAKGVMLWLLGAAVISLWAVPLEPLLISTGSATAAFKIRLGITAVFLPLLYLAIARYGLIGSGQAAVLGACMLTMGQLWLVWRWFGKPPLHNA
jgi:O-antigen/teichoic acid export membrane protein